MTERPRLISCYFTEGERWPRLAGVLEHTAHQHCQGWDIRVSRLQMPTQPAIADCYAANSHKLAHWCQEVDAAPDGTPMLLIDADTAILRPLDDIWDQPFDMAYTVRPPRSRYPFNAGVVFVRASLRSRAFLAYWLDVNQRFLGNQRDHETWKRRYGGINQAALGHVLDLCPNVFGSVQLLTLPCATWNCEDDSWATFDPQATRILHVKSDLRRLVFGGPKQAARSQYAELCALWQRLDREAEGDASQVGGAARFSAEILPCG